jgi:serine/threonine protein phosphatase 1
MGNHEQFLRLVLEDDARFLGAWHLWRRNGGGEALRSFGLRDLAAIGLPPNQNEAHQRLVDALGPARVDFIRRLKSHVMLDSTNILFVHAGIDPHVTVEHGLDIPWDDIEDASHWAWIRDEFLDFEPEFPEELPLVVHGHTIEEPTMQVHRIGLDSGAHANRVLTAVEIAADRARFIQVSDP